VADFEAHSHRERNGTVNPYLGDFEAGKVVSWAWASFNAAGSSITRATNGTLLAYRNGDATTEVDITTACDVEDFDGKTGVHSIKIDLAALVATFPAGNDYQVVLTGATIDGQTVNAPLFCFSVENRTYRANTVEVLGDPVEASTGPAPADIVSVNGTTFSGANVPSTASVTGTVAANITQVNGTTFSGANVPSTATVSGTVAANVTQVNGTTFAGASVPAAGTVIGTVSANVTHVGGAALVSGRVPASLAANAPEALTVEGSVTVGQLYRLLLSLLAGKSTGHDTDTPAYRDQADTKNRVLFAVDADGNRTVTGLDLS
jgi:hypothetical protein